MRLVIAAQTNGNRTLSARSMHCCVHGAAGLSHARRHGASPTAFVDADADGIGGLAPMSRIPASRINVLTLHVCPPF